MASEKKRVATGLAEFNDFFTETVMQLPEFVNNPEAIPEYLKGAVKEIAGLAFKANREGYHGVYIPSKDFIKKQKHKLMQRMAEETGLSTNSIEKLGTVIGGIASLVEKGEVEIPSTRLVDREDITVQAGGYANIVDDIYRANLVGQIKNPFGIEGFTARGKVEGSFDQPFENVNVEGSYQVGDASTLSFGVDPINESARLGFKTTWKKGGKVTKKRKKRKTKKYTKGCVVRTAKY